MNADTIDDTVITEIRMTHFAFDERCGNFEVAQKRFNAGPNVTNFQDINGVALEVVLKLLMELPASFEMTCEESVVWMNRLENVKDNKLTFLKFLEAFNTEFSYFEILPIN